MGVVLTINGYRKSEEFISGEIKVLGWYEVDTRIYESQLEIRGSESHIRNIPKVFEEAINRYSVFGLEGPADVAFMYCVSDGISGGGYRIENGTTYVVMFDAARILDVVRQLIHNIGESGFDLDTMKYDKENLNYLAQALEIIAKEDGMVWLSWG